jgi:hypothetical protein
MDGWILARYIELGVDSTNLESQGLLLESVQRLRNSEESIRSSEIGFWVDTCSGASFNPARYIQAAKAFNLGHFYQIACKAYFEAADNLNWDLLRQFKPVVFAALA